MVALRAAPSICTLHPMTTVWEDEINLVSSARSALHGVPYIASLDRSDGSIVTVFTRGFP